MSEGKGRPLTREDYERAAQDYLAKTIPENYDSLQRRFEEAERRAEQEKQRADEVEAELQRLRAVLAQFQGGTPQPPQTTP